MASSAQAQDAQEARAFGAAVFATAPKQATVVTLHRALRMLDPTSSLAHRLDALEAVGRWIVDGPRPPKSMITREESPQATRLGLLIHALDILPEVRQRLAAVAGSVLAATTSLTLFAETGVPNDRGLMHETSDRLARRFLPTPPDHGNLAELIERIIQRKSDATWIAEARLELFAQIGAHLGPIWTPLRTAMADAVALLTTRIAALGLSEDIRARSPEGPLRGSPFYRIAHVPVDQVPALVGDCRACVENAHTELERIGVSVDVVYCLDTIGRLLDRIEGLLPLFAGVAPGAPGAAGARLATAHAADLDVAGPPLAAARALLATLCEARLQDRSLRQLLRNNMRLLARKVVERAGQTGEHYVTATKGEYFKMLASAAGGGILTLATVVGKFFTKWGHYPLFVDGALSSLNYAASFIIMQLCGFTLATKQPSLTAAALAGTIRETKGDNRLADLVTMIARISRSQFAAALGNIGAVIPAVLVFSFVWKQSIGADFLSEEAAHSAIASFHPLKSATIPFAALTGVFLWFSSLGAGWVSNWVAYRRLPEAIEHHRSSRTLGSHRMRRIARFVDRHVSGIGGSITLGVLLGMTPVLGKFFGLPLDVRHVTLSTGTLTFAIVSLGPQALATGDVQAAMIGIVVIGLLNFGVSFALALAVAFRAREVSQMERLRLAGAVLRRFLRSPREFFYPPKRASGRPATAATH